MPARIATLLVALALLIPLTLPVTTHAAPIGSDAFQRTWARTDQPVSEGRVDRTWMWGPGPFTDVVPEPYAESPGGQRQVQYFDKSRMELTYPNIDPASPWAVTNGLLVVEMVTGRLQLGDEAFENHLPAEVNIAGDPDDFTGPTYATFAALLSLPPLADGAVINQRVDRSGAITTDNTLAAWNVQAGPLVAQTQHRVASVFWEFLHSEGAVYVDDEYTTARLFEPWYYASGLPISEAYWTTVLVGGTPHEVLVQAFERRVLTYTPNNPVGWQVESGNVGLHYQYWRYYLLPWEEPFDVLITDCSDIAAVRSILEAGGRIKFACGETTLTLPGTVAITSDTTIDGGGVTTLSGGDSHRILTIVGNTAGVTVTLRGLTIADGSADLGGGIYADGIRGKRVTLNLESVILRENTAGSGGAIYSDGYQGNATLAVTNTTFEENAADLGGGAVLSSGNEGSATFSATSCLFLRNSANWGGAVLSNGDNQGSAMFNSADSNFARNLARSGGGAVFSSANAGTASLTFTGTAFDGNTAADSGGAAFSGSASGGVANLEVVNTQFTRNSAGRGGAVESHGETGGSVTLSVESSKFSSNAATDSGGAIDSRGGGFNNSGNAELTINDSGFDHNTAAGDAGAVYSGSVAYYSAASTTLTITNATFISNSARDGGALRIESQSGAMSATIADSTFVGNWAEHNGGAIGSNATDYYYGAPSPGGSVQLSATNLSFSANSAYQGGALYAEAGYDSSLSASATDSTFDGNSASSGGAIHARIAGPSAEVTVDLGRTAFTNNVAVFSGGAIYSSSGGYASGMALTTTDATFAANSATRGGAVYSDGSSGGNARFIATGVTFQGNAATWGGAIYNDGTVAGSALFAATNVTFSGNTAINGGAVYTDGNGFGNSRFDATNDTFRGNSATVGDNILTLSAVTSLANSILATDGSANCRSDNGIYTSHGGNLADDDSCGLTQPTDLQSTDPLLGPLQDNGGPTLTHALLPGSPAIDSGDPTNCPATDQRGVTRPQDGDGDGVAVCDRGAVEMSAATSAAATDGDAIQTQYFERAMFEWHPDNVDPYKVLLRRLGAEELVARGW